VNCSRWSGNNPGRPPLTPATLPRKTSSNKPSINPQDTRSPSVSAGTASTANQTPKNREENSVFSINQKKQTAR
jgi:hypothetical protein